MTWGILTRDNKNGNLNMFVVPKWPQIVKTLIFPNYCIWQFIAKYIVITIILLCSLIFFLGWALSHISS